MPMDFTTYEFVEGNTYAIDVEPGSDAVRVAHHGEGRVEPQDSYGTLEYSGAVGSGPWRTFQDWETETEVTIDAHHILDVRERTEH